MGHVSWAHSTTQMTRRRDRYEAGSRACGDSLGKPAAPLEEGIALPALELEHGHLAVPGRAAGHLEPVGVLALLVAELLLLLRREQIRVVRRSRERRVRDDLDVLPLCDADTQSYEIHVSSGRVWRIGVRWEAV